MACRADSGSTQLHRLRDGKSRVAGEDTPPLLRERSPIPEPPAGFWERVRVDAAAPAQGRQKSRRGRGYAPIAPRAFADPRASVGVLGAGAGQRGCTGSGTAKEVRRPPRLPCTDAFRCFGEPCYRRCDRATCRTWAAITASSSVGITQADTRLAGLLIRGPWAALASGSISTPSHSSPAAIRARI